jgi:hypothetical protein
MNNFKKSLAAALGVSVVLAGQATFANISWDLAGDWNPPANPNGTWSYGQISGAGGAFTPLPWIPVSGSPVADGIYGAGNPSAPTGGFVFKNTGLVPAYGTAPGQVSLESDNGSAAVQWTAPATGKYDLSVAIGGTTAADSFGTGNAFAQFAGLDINGNVLTPNSFVNNIKSWDINNVSLIAGETIDAYVLNPGYSGSGNTQTAFTVTAVPEPSTYLAGALMLVPFGSSALRQLRKKFQAA